MTVPRLREMTDYWRDNPPIHLMVASYFGLHGKKPSTQQEGDLATLLAGIPMTEHQGPKPT